MSKPNTNYFRVLRGVIDHLPENSGSARRAVYARARIAIVEQLRAFTPALSASEITNEQLRLEDAIRRVEMESVRPVSAAPGSAGSPAPEISDLPGATAEADDIVVGQSLSGTPQFMEDALAAAEHSADRMVGWATLILAALAAFVLFTGMIYAWGERDTALSWIASVGFLVEERLAGDADLPETPDNVARQVAPAVEKDATRLSSGSQNLRIAPDARIVDATEIETAGLDGTLTASLPPPGAPAGTVSDAPDKSSATGKTDNAAGEALPLPAKRPGEEVPTPPVPEIVDEPAPQAAGPAVTLTLFDLPPVAGDGVPVSYAGSVNWRAETDGGGRVTALVADVEIQPEGRSLAIRILPNRDPELSATHIMEFILDDWILSIEEEIRTLEEIRIKPDAPLPAAALQGVPARVSANLLWFALIDDADSRARNLAALSGGVSIEIVIIQENGARGVLDIAFGAAGRRLLTDALSEWQS